LLGPPNRMWRSQPRNQLMVSKQGAHARSCAQALHETSAAADSPRVPDPQPQGPGDAKIQKGIGCHAQPPNRLLLLRRSQATPFKAVAPFNP
jgi:hypothetical protein